jgi:hypothetical protein
MEHFITHVGGNFGLKSEGEVIAEIQTGANTYFVTLGTRRVFLEVNSGVTRKFLKSTIDAYRPDTLLSLRAEAA